MPSSPPSSPCPRRSLPSSLIVRLVRSFISRPPSPLSRPHLVPLVCCSAHCSPARPLEILFLDTDTAVCAPLARVFSVLAPTRFSPAAIAAMPTDGVGGVDGVAPASGPSVVAAPEGKRGDVAFVPIPAKKGGGGGHNSQALTKVFGVPSDFPEANTGVLVMRNSTATQRLLMNWNIAYHVLTRNSAHLMDQVKSRGAGALRRSSYVLRCSPRVLRRRALRRARRRGLEVLEFVGWLS